MMTRPTALLLLLLLLLLLHADRTAPPAIKYHGYKKGQAVPSDTGVLVAAFDGMHGWFWRNRTTVAVTVTLRVAGDYRDWTEVR